MKINVSCSPSFEKISHPRFASLIQSWEKLKIHVYRTISSRLDCDLSFVEVMLFFFQQIAKLRLQLQRSKQVSRQSKDREQGSLQLSQQAQHGIACQPQVSYSCLAKLSQWHAIFW